VRNHNLGNTRTIDRLRGVIFMMSLADGHRTPLNFVVTRSMDSISPSAMRFIFPGISALTLDLVPRGLPTTINGNFRELVKKNVGESSQRRGSDKTFRTLRTVRLLRMYTTTIVVPIYNVVSTAIMRHPFSLKYRSLSKFSVYRFCTCHLLHSITTGFRLKMVKYIPISLAFVATLLLSVKAAPTAGPYNVEGRDDLIGKFPGYKRDVEGRDDLIGKLPDYKRDDYNRHLPDYKRDDYNRHLPDYKRDDYNRHLPDYKRDDYNRHLPDYKRDD
jgi:hypothetical protein